MTKALAGKRVRAALACAAGQDGPPEPDRERRESRVAAGQPGAGRDDPLERGTSFLRHRRRHAPRRRGRQDLAPAVRQAFPGVSISGVIEPGSRAAVAG